MDSIQNLEYRDTGFYAQRKYSKVWKKIREESLIKVEQENFYLTIDPVFNLSYGKEFSEDITTHVNTRGFLINGSITDKFSFSTNFYESQTVFPNYLGTYIRGSEVVPGQGRARRFKENGYDYAIANGYISYTPSQYFNVQFGHGKNFIGDGYRSLLLSDVAFNYPYLKLATQVWKIKYYNLYTQFQDIRFRDTYESGYQRKYSTMHYLSINIGRRLQLGLYESVVWQAKDSSGNRGFDVNYLNPIIFFRPVEFALGSPDNSLMGLNAKYKVLDNLHVYGQFILDDFNISKTKEDPSFFQNKYGFQLGFRSFDIFNIRNLHFQSEINQVRPYTYAHKTPLQNYAHYNQPLAHPLGANFRELLAIINYNYKDFYIDAKFVYALRGEDSTGTHFGSDLYRSDRETDLFSFGNYVGQGVRNDLYFLELVTSYLINPATNLRFQVGYQYRFKNSEILSMQTNHFFVGISTNLRNIYYDF